MQPRPFLQGIEEVWIEAIYSNKATVKDRFGNRLTIPTDVMRAKGATPWPGERWIVTRDLGKRTFLGIAGPTLGPEVVVDDDFNAIFMLGGV